MEQAIDERFGGAAMTVLVGDAAGPAGDFGSGSEVPRHGRFDPYDEVPVEYGPDEQGCGDEDDGPPEPPWVLDAAAEDLWERLAAAVHAPGGADAAEVIEVLSASLPGATLPGPVPSGTMPSGAIPSGAMPPGATPSGAMPPGATPSGAMPPGAPPDRDAARDSAGTVDAAGLVAGIRVVARLVNHFQAVQQQWIAALARPGVAVPLDQVVEMCRHPGRSVPGALRPPDELPDDLPTDDEGDPDLRPLLDHPAWRAPLADAAARLAAAEVGCALRLAPVTARARVEQALAMVDELPATFTAQYRGDLDGYRASIIADRTDVLTGPQRARVERRVLPGAGSRTPGVLRDQVDRAVIAADPDAAARRVERARAGRGVRLDKARDDMAEFRALVGCADGHLAFGVLDEQATALTAAGLAAGRGASQLRADVFCDLFRTLARTGHAHLTNTPPSSNASSPDAPSPDAPSPDVEHELADGESAAARDAGRGDGGTGVRPCHDRCTDPPGGDRGSGGSIRPAGSVAGRRRSTALNVYLDVATLAGLDDRAGELAGFGCITAATARALVASADTVRALVVRPATDVTATLDRDPPPAGSRAPGHSDDSARARTCGTVLDAGRAVYRPPEALLDYVTARDRTCTWPGCRAPAHRCDADHRQAFGDGGPTCACNLDLLCRWHHRAKTFTAWSAVPGPDGALVWTSPIGHRYPAESGHPIPGHPIPGHSIPGHPMPEPPGNVGEPRTEPADPDPPSESDPPPF